jgi:hypothetical protein
MLKCRVVMSGAAEARDLRVVSLALLADRRNASHWCHPRGRSQTITSTSVAARRQSPSTSEHSYSRVAKLTLSTLKPVSGEFVRLIGPFRGAGCTQRGHRELSETILQTTRLPQETFGRLYWSSVTLRASTTCSRCFTRSMEAQRHGPCAEPGGCNRHFAPRLSSIVA